MPLIDNDSTTLNIQEQRNADGSLQYIKFKWKGSIIKVGYGYDANGLLTSVTIPSCMNLSHWEILELINGLFIQSIGNQSNPPTVKLLF
jgi:hypothetical protein